MYFIKAQESRHEWWRYFVTLLPPLFVYFIIGSLPLYLVIYLKQMQGVPIDLQEFVITTNPEAIGISRNFGLLLLLLPSVLGFFALWFAIMKIHATTSGNIASAEGKIRWNRFFRAAGLWLVFLIVAELIFAAIHPENYRFQFDLKQFLPLLLISLALVPFQTFFEELLFRGYLMQGTGLLFRSRLIALLLTSAGFGMLHVFNPEVNEFGMLATMPYYMGFGLFAGLLVIYDNGIEMACGVHAVNNIFGAVLVTYESSVLKTPAAWSIRETRPWDMNIAFLLMAVLFIYIMARRYNWEGWKKIIRRIPSGTVAESAERSL